MKKAPVERNVDRVFDACILLVTILATAELSYVAYLCPSTVPSYLVQVNYFFRVTTSVIIALVVSWIS